jgi:hypothetical protein
MRVARLKNTTTEEMLKELVHDPRILKQSLDGFKPEKESNFFRMLDQVPVIGYVSHWILFGIRSKISLQPVDSEGNNDFFGGNSKFKFEFSAKILHFPCGPYDFVSQASTVFLRELLLFQPSHEQILAWKIMAKITSIKIPALLTFMCIPYPLNIDSGVTWTLSSSENSSPCVAYYCLKPVGPWANISYNTVYSEHKFEEIRYRTVYIIT